MNHKRILAVLLALTLMLGMAACTKNEGNGGNEGGSNGNLPLYSQGIDENGFFEGVTAKDYVTLGQYKGIEVPASAVEVSQSQVESEVQSMISSFTEMKEVTDRPAQLGDFTNIDYAGYMDGEQFDGGTGNNPSLELGSGSFIGGFEDGIVGHNVGDEFDLELSFPDPYPNNPDLAGKPVTFHVTLNSISEQVDPVLTDAFVKEHFEADYGWTTVAGMRSGIEEELKRDALYNYVFTQIEDYEVSDVPEPMFQYEVNNMKAYYEQMAAMYGMTLEDFLSGMGMGTIDDLVEQSREQLTATARSSMIYQAIAETEGLSVTQEDIDAQFADTDEDSYNDIVEFYGMPYVKMILLSNKVAELVVDNVVIK